MMKGILTQHDVHTSLKALGWKGEQGKEGVRYSHPKYPGHQLFVHEFGTHHSVKGEHVAHVGQGWTRLHKHLNESLGKASQHDEEGTEQFGESMSHHVLLTERGWEHTGKAGLTGTHRVYTHKKRRGEAIHYGPSSGGWDHIKMGRSIGTGTNAKSLHAHLTSLATQHDEDEAGEEIILTGAEPVLRRSAGPLGPPQIPVAVDTEQFDEDNLEYKIHEHLFHGSDSIQALRKKFGGKAKYNPGNPLAHPVHKALKNLNDKKLVDIHGDIVHGHYPDRKA